MSGSTTIRLIMSYLEMAMPTTFLSSLFRSPPQNFHSSEEVEVDIMRQREDVAVVITDISTGYRANEANLYTNKGWKPPVYKESIPLNGIDMIKRNAGETPFANPDLRANVVSRFMRGMLLIEAKVRRAIELQSSQVLTTGKLDLKDSDDNSLYEVDYKPKATHFPTASVTWGSDGADPGGDIIALCEVIRTDGLVMPNMAIMGQKAFEEGILKDADTVNRLNFRRAEVARVEPMRRMPDGGIHRGRIEFGNSEIDIFTYDGRYELGTTVTQYIPAGYVVLLNSERTRLDLTFGAIPNIGELLGVTGVRQMIPELPPRFPNPDGGMDLFTNAWLSPDGETLFGGVGCRPLAIPTAIDTYGCLNTGLV